MEPGRAEGIWKVVSDSLKQIRRQKGRRLDKWSLVGVVLEERECRGIKEIGGTR